MSKEQYATEPVAQARMIDRSTGQPARSGRTRSRLLHFLIGPGIALVLICSEGLLWILNPSHLFGKDAPHSLASLLATLLHTPLLLLIPLFELVIVSGLVLLSERPRVIRAYRREIQSSLEGYRTLYTPLTTWKVSYTTSVAYHQDTPGATISSSPQSMSLSELARERHSHLLVLGSAGMGKTTFLRLYQYISLQRGAALMFGRDHIPIYIPLNQYSLFLQALQEAIPEEGMRNGNSMDGPGRPQGYAPTLHEEEHQGSTDVGSQKGTLLDFLLSGDLAGLHYLRPYLNRLIAQGRIVFLCDGLDEVDERYQAVVNIEVAQLMSQQQNRVVVTDSEAHFRRQQELVRAASENLVARATFLPLDMGQIRDFIEQYIDSGASLVIARSGNGRRHTAGQIIDVITHSAVREQYSNPMLLFLLLEIIDEIGVERAKRIDTRGRLLQEFMLCLIRYASRTSHQRSEVLTEEILLLLGELAWAGGADQSAVSTVNQPLPGLYQTYSSSTMDQILQFARHVALIEESPGGTIRFRHQLIAAYLVGYYLKTAMGDSLAAGQTGQIDNGALAQHILSDIECHAVAVVMWAGLVDNALVLAERICAHTQKAPIETLVFSLLCIGTAWLATQGEKFGQVGIPPAVEQVATAILSDAGSRQQLADHFTRCAENGAEEIYQSLFPMLMIDGTELFIPLLDPLIVPDLLFKQLCAIVDKGAYEQQVKRLVRVLGHCGATAVPRAAELSQVAAGRSLRLRSAAINILGGTGEASAVPPLLVCLGDKDQFVMNRAISALIRLGPEHVLSPLLQELRNHTPSAVRKQIHLATGKILERFLAESSPARRLNQFQYQSVINLLLAALSANYAVEVQEAAREILVQQGQSESGEKAIDLLVQNLASSDEGTARSALKTLQDIGRAATSHLIGLLRQQPPELARVRIVEVFGYVRDERALPYLLTLLADPSMTVQQYVALALRAYSPASIAGLIDVALHSDSDFVAIRAEQVLGDIGADVVNPVIQALSPVEPERTHLLVHVLERVRDPRALPALISLLQTAQAEHTLQLAIIHALGEFADGRAVPPLLAMLAHSNPMLYEGAINALSRLGAVTLDQLIESLEVYQDAELIAHVQRAILGMAHFPGEQLLNSLARASDAQAERIIDIFLEKGAEAAQVVVANLFHPNRRVQDCVRLMVGEMSGRIIVPPLLDELNRPEAHWREIISEYLLRHPHEAIPPLVALLDDPERGEPAFAVLSNFGPEILPMLVPGLDSLNNLAQERSRHILVELVRQMPEAIHEVVQLFNLGLPQRARETLVHLLVYDLAEISIPTLLQGLEDAHLVGHVSEVLVRIVQEDGRSGEIALNELLDSLRIESRRHGAAFTLVDIGERAVPGVGRLITDTDADVAEAAQNILSEMGVPAFAFIWSAQSDTSNPERREAARTIFRKMRTVVIKDELVELLKSSELDKVSMALILLLERIHDEALQPGSEHEMIPALLEHVQTHSDEQASLRVLALLLLLGTNMVLAHMVQALYDYPNHQERIIQAFLLLGEEAEEALLDMLHDSDAPGSLRAEAAGVLGIIAPHQDIREYASMLGEYGLWAGRSTGRASLLQPDRLAISLRALGGLLAGGHWDINELLSMRNASREGSAERELYDILLGWRYSPHVSQLEHELEHEREQHKQAILNFTDKIFNMNAEIEELEHELEQVRQEHSSRSEELEQAVREIEHLQANLNEALQEKQTMRNRLQQALKENEALRSENQRWSAYSDQLENEIKYLKGS
ncbi:MAG TPA: HEAT repeat domain-containing protein [Ktedonobacteraceae bacterium]|jgi:HEAT repeat protein|nr:HEAT repeat domain-containing protein [Ktedonobacteraceae bacterium]